MQLIEKQNVTLSDQLHRQPSALRAVSAKSEASTWSFFGVSSLKAGLSSRSAPIICRSENSTIKHCGHWMLLLYPGESTACNRKRMFGDACGTRSGGESSSMSGREESGLPGLLGVRSHMLLGVLSMSLSSSN